MSSYLHQVTLIGDYLLAHQQQITCVESCTGGGLAAAFTDIAGSSAWFEQGYVTYSNQAKHQMVGVSLATLARYGAVSQQVAQEMAEKGLRQAKANFSVAITGIAGPGGGSLTVPVGSVYLAFAQKQGDTLICHQQFTGDRQQVRQQAILFALNTLVEKILLN